MLNGEIVKAGYASVMTIPPNVKYKDRFFKAYNKNEGHPSEGFCQVKTPLLCANEVIFLR